MVHVTFHEEAETFLPHRQPPPLFKIVPGCSRENCKYGRQHTFVSRECIQLKLDSDSSTSAESMISFGVGLVNKTIDGSHGAYLNSKVMLSISWKFKPHIKKNPGNFSKKLNLPSY